MISFALIALLATPPDPALAALRAGVEAFRQGRHAEAERLLTSAEPEGERLGRSAQIWWYLGQTHDALGRPCEALRWYAKAVDARDAPVDAIRTRMARAERSAPAEIHVQCGTPGTRVQRDGEAEPVECPAQWAALPAGRHIIRATIDGRAFAPLQAFARPCRITRIEVRPAGQLRVTSPTPGAVVVLDDTVVGPAPQHLTALPPAEYALEVRAVGYQSATRTVRVPSGGEATHAVPLWPVGPAVESATERRAEAARSPRTWAWLATFGAAGALAGSAALLWSPASRDDHLVAGVALGAGGLGLAGLATWLFLSDEASGAAVGPQGVGWRGRF